MMAVEAFKELFPRKSFAFSSLPLIGLFSVLQDLTGRYGSSMGGRRPASEGEGKAAGGRKKGGGVRTMQAGRGSCRGS
ncbi:hypothetical protein Cni_G19976 [Canna indica]|uniref:Uncharacterized protein n=1 Tax=Canna indica TaxID=4628 RepID=A0AAQ3KM97_9LILI|nr:hypothetical protein Cni_G19976 [Canna indica]